MSRANLQALFEEIHRGNFYAIETVLREFDRLHRELGA